MSFTFKIKRTGESSFTDYSNFVDAQADVIAMKSAELNKPQKLIIALREALGFLDPERHNEVQLDCSTYSPSGELFTGFIIKDPAKSFAGIDPDGVARYSWSLVIASEEIILDLAAPKHFPTLPPFMNKFAGEIVSDLYQLLAPDRFDVAGVEDGPFVPYFEVKPEESFTIAVARLCDGLNLKHFTRRGKAFLVAFDDTTLGVDVSDADPDFTPVDLTVNPQSLPIQNDVIGAGDVEPQTYVREYNVGDGLTMRFPLAVKMFGAVQNKLLQDDWNDSSLDENMWVETDPGNHISEGPSLFVDGGSGIDATKLVSKNGVEMGGTIILQHGTFRFNSASSGIVGGLYTSPSAHTEANCQLGYAFMPSGAQTDIKVLVNGGTPANYFESSDDIADSAWLKQAMASVVSDVSASPDTGEIIADEITFASGGGSSPFFLQVPAFPVLSGRTCTMRFWARRVSGTGSILARIGQGGKSDSFEQTLAGLSSSMQLYTLTTTFDIATTNSGQCLIARVGVIGEDVIEVAGFVAFYGSGEGVYVSTGASIVEESFLQTEAGFDYLLVTQVRAPESIRYNRGYYSLATPSGFPGSAVDSPAHVSFLIYKLDQDDPSAEPDVTELYSSDLPSVDGFLTYVPVNSSDLNLAINFNLIVKPLDAVLLTEPASGGNAEWSTRLMGFDREFYKDATVVTEEEHVLGFFGDEAPKHGEKIEIRYREAGLSRARVQDSSSITDEASRAGDDGIRAGILPKFDSPPRNAEELELAIKAYINDHVNPVYDGEFRIHTFKTTPPREPIPGRFLTVAATGQQPSFQGFVNSVETSILGEFPSGTEQMIHKVKFGPVFRFDNALMRFNRRNEGAIGGERAVVKTDPVAYDDVGTTFIDPATEARFTYTYTDSTFGIDFGAVPPTGNGGDAGHFEVRSTDAGWGIPGGGNLVAEPSGQTTTLVRSSRRQTYWMKPVKPVNICLHSGWEDETSYYFELKAHAPSASYDGTVGFDDLGCQKLVYPSGWSGCSDTCAYFDNHLAVNVPSGTKTAYRFRYKASRALTGSEELRFLVSGTAAIDGTVNLTSAEITSANFSEWQEVTAVSDVHTDVGSFRIWNFISGVLASELTLWVDDMQFEVAPPNGVVSRYYKTTDKPKGPVSRHPALVQVNYPFIPDAIPSANIDITDRTAPKITLVLPSDTRDVFGVQIRDDDDSTELYSYGDAVFAVIPDDPALSWVYPNSPSGVRTKTLFAYTWNRLKDYAASSYQIDLVMPAIDPSGLAVDSAGMALTWDEATGSKFFEYEVSPSSSFSPVESTGIVEGTSAPLSLLQIVRDRWMRVRCNDGIGFGDWTTLAHSYSPLGVESFDNSNNVFTVVIFPEETMPSEADEYESSTKQEQGEVYDAPTWTNPRKMLVGNLTTLEPLTAAFHAEVYPSGDTLPSARIQAAGVLARRNSEDTKWKQDEGIYFANLSNGVTYKVRVRVAIRGGGNPSTWSSFVTETLGDSAPPSASYSFVFAATSQGGVIALSPSSLDTDIHHYEHYWATSGASDDPPAVSAIVMEKSDDGVFPTDVGSGDLVINVYTRAVDWSGNRQAWVSVGSYTSVDLIDADSLIKTKNYHDSASRVLSITLRFDDTQSASWISLNSTYSPILGRDGTFQGTMRVILNTAPVGSFVAAPASALNDDSAGPGNLPWNNPEFMVDPPTGTATVGESDQERTITTEYLKCIDFSWSPSDIPTADTVVNVKVEWHGLKMESGDGVVSEETCLISRDGIVTGTPIVNDQVLGTSAVWFTMGDQSPSAWGIEITPEYLNAPGWGAAFSVDLDTDVAGDAEVDMDQVRITVTTDSGTYVMKGRLDIDGSPSNEITMTSPAVSATGTVSLGGLLKGIRVVTLQGQIASQSGSGGVVLIEFDQIEYEDQGQEHAG